jgi:hypothetical protein
MRRIHYLALLLPLLTGIACVALDASDILAADNVQITPGSGSAIATDDVGGVQYQKFKLVDGTADGATPAIVTSDGALRVASTPAADGGLSVGPASGAKLISAATTNATSVKAGGGQIYGWSISNVNAAARFVKLYDKASAPTVGTDVPVMTILVPGATTGGQAVYSAPAGIAFPTGIALAITTGVGNADTGAVAANEIVVNLFFK